jgi:nucleoside-diphosphate-sugar epimerase
MCVLEQQKSSAPSLYKAFYPGLHSQRLWYTHHPPARHSHHANTLEHMRRERQTMKFLVTGATGFIGARVVARLLQEHIPTVAADVRLDPEVTTKLERTRPKGADLAYSTLDVSDARQVAEVFDKHPDITHCVHLAYLMSAEVEADQRRGAEVNIVGMANMFDAAARQRLRRLVFASSETVYGASQAVYGGPSHAIDEDEYCGPQHHLFTYGVMKLLNEFVASKYVQRHGISIACLRPPVVFGHGRKR